MNTNRCPTTLCTHRTPSTVDANLRSPTLFACPSSATVFADPFPAALFAIVLLSSVRTAPFEAVAFGICDVPLPKGADFLSGCSTQTGVEERDRRVEKDLNCLKVPTATEFFSARSRVSVMASDWWGTAPARRWGKLEPPQEKTEEGAVWADLFGGRRANGRGVLLCSTILSAFCEGKSKGGGLPTNLLPFRRFSPDHIGWRFEK
uniref:Uncharacterized protein n=1 Tax=Chromera velia CCMP2878 TaxID=1169474 RepID=A0A0G4FJH9_9ALVE|eukprot:Cvel_17306.t1-p1 / transcript=Cvel_17306.t1 / gene=Cvel_17306 / organism=Chromera_velia_CCMP2878 / gene_product=hypothetical protein / transcript_product=hypothetical protein / location=Cvel_scaffold1374:10277-10973(+) / protein_length=204 / sequence_SO=supercontig / SO=protein_coding / is_pseudo=false